jgi:NAD(P)H-nitrite reductase large subunit
LTAYLLAGTLQKEDLCRWGPDFYRTHNIDIHLNQRVVRVLPEETRIELSGERYLYYDRLLIATGARARPLEIEGANLGGVFTLRTLAGAEAISKRCQGARSAVVVGGGLVGMKVADGLLKSGLRLTMVVASRQVLSQMLDPKAAKIVRQRLEEAGVAIQTGVSVARIGEREGNLSWVETDAGQRIEADLMIVGKGVIPNTSLVADTAIVVHDGVVVDQYMRTSVQNIFAAGDVAEAPNLLKGGHSVNAIWPSAVWQGKVAGHNMAGGRASCPGNLRMNILEVCGLSSAVVGEACNTEDNSEMLERHDPRGWGYRRIVLERGQVKGAILISEGDVSQVGVFHYLIHQRIDVSKWKWRLLEEDLNPLGWVGGLAQRSTQSAICKIRGRIQGWDKRSLILS